MSEVRKAITVAVRVRPDHEVVDPILVTNGTRVEMKGGVTLWDRFEYMRYGMMG